MLEFRKLAEVEQATELMEGEEVLISDGEKVKKIAPEKIGEHVPENLKKAAADGDGFGYTDEDGIHQIDSKYIKKEELVPEEIEKAIETGGIGYSIGEKKTINSIEEPEVYVEVGTRLFYKVSDEIPTAEDLIGGTITWPDGQSIVITEDMISTELSNLIIVEPQIDGLDGFIVVGRNNMHVEGIVFVETGIYFVMHNKN